MYKVLGERMNIKKCLNQRIDRQEEAKPDFALSCVHELLANLVRFKGVKLLQQLKGQIKSQKNILFSFDLLIKKKKKISN